jgi:heme o synthase
MFSAYLELTKPRILLLVLITEALGFFLASRGVIVWVPFAISLLGTALSCAGAAALNHYLERDIDALMKRTCKRPLPAGIIEPQRALMFGILLVLAGVTLLVAKINLLAGFLSLLTAFLYVLVYTPLKRVTWLNTLVGAIPGALPPMGGWAAATGTLDTGAWILFLIMFIWQQPHFYSIAWMYREDYARGGLRMLPVVDPDGRSTFRQIILFSVGLIPVSLAPYFLGLSGPVYAIGALLLGLFMLAAGITLSRTHTVADARKLLRASIVYLPILLLLIIGDVHF